MNEHVNAVTLACTLHRGEGDKDADEEREAVEGGQAVMDETKEMQQRQLVDRLEVAGQPKAGSEKKDNTAKTVSILHELERCT